MKDQPDIRDAVGTGVLADTRRRCLRDLVRHLPGLVSPALVSHFEHVAVVAGQVTAAVDLDNELPERDGTPAVGHDRRDIEHRWPLGRPRSHTVIEPHVLAHDRAWPTGARSACCEAPRPATDDRREIPPGTVR